MRAASQGHCTQADSDTDVVTERLLEIPADTKMVGVSAADSTVVTLENGIQLRDFSNTDSEKVTTEIKSTTLHLDNIEDNLKDRGLYRKCMEATEDKLGHVCVTVKHFVVKGFKPFLLLLYLAYFAYCMYYRFGDEGSIILVIITACLLLHVCRKLVMSKCNMRHHYIHLVLVLASPCGRKFRLIIRYCLYILALSGLCVFLGLDVLHEHPQNCQSLLGIASLILICMILSKKPSRINWHPVFWGFVIQFVFAIVTLRTEVGYSIFKWTGDMMQTLLKFSDAGSVFVLGPNFKTMGLAFAILGTIVFFNCLIFLLTHWGVIEVIVVKMGTVLGFCLETGPVESINAVANIFMGFSEVGLLIRPYLVALSRSELCAVMTGGFASVAGGAIAVFVQMGAPANHLLTAAVISAPAALALTKVIYPETEVVDFSKQTDIKLRDSSDKSRSALSVVAEGAMMAMKITVPIVANMLAFVSLLTMIDAMLDWMGQRAGVDGLSFEFICSFLLYPLSYVMGVVPEDCGKVGALIGLKVFATPMVGYAELGKLIKNRHVLDSYIKTTNGSWHWAGRDIVLDAFNSTLVNGVITERSEVITTYAMCGFSAITAIGICIGTMTPLCPERKQDIMQIVVIAFIAGNFASFATGAVAGVMHSPHSMGDVS